MQNRKSLGFLFPGRFIAVCGQVAICFTVILSLPLFASEEWDKTQCVFVSGLSRDKTRYFIDFGYGLVETQDYKVFGKKCKTVYSWDEINPLDFPEGEQILIVQAAHGVLKGGASTGKGYVKSSQILKKITELSEKHRVGFFNESCYSADLQKELLVQQYNNAADATNDNLCMMSASYFSRISIGNLAFANDKENYLKNEESPQNEFANLEEFSAKSNRGVSSSTPWAYLGLDQYFNDPESSDYLKLIKKHKQVVARYSQNEFYKKTYQFCFNPYSTLDSVRSLTTGMFHIDGVTKVDVKTISYTEDDLKAGKEFPDAKITAEYWKRQIKQAVETVSTGRKFTIYTKSEWSDFAELLGGGTDACDVARSKILKTAIEQSTETDLSVEILYKRFKELSEEKAIRSTFRKSCSRGDPSEMGYIKYELSKNHLREKQIQQMNHLWRYYHFYLKGDRHSVLANYLESKSKEERQLRIWNELMGMTEKVIPSVEAKKVGTEAAIKALLDASKNIPSDKLPQLDRRRRKACENFKLI